VQKERINSAEKCAGLPDVPLFDIHFFSVSYQCKTDTSQAKEEVPEKSTDSLKCASGNLVSVCMTRVYSISLKHVRASQKRRSLQTAGDMHRAAGEERITLGEEK
jgi:hypothetical protein